MAGVQNQIGIGSAQVLPEGPSHMPLAQQLFRQKAYQDEQDRYNQRLKEQNNKDLYGLIGDALNLKDFNPVIHDRVKQAQIKLAEKIKLENPSYADTYLAAQNEAATLGQVSQGLNQADQIIAATKKEYEPDKRINAANVEGIARKMILDDLKANGKIDPSRNYFDEALNKHPEFALTDKSDYTVTKFIPEEKQSLSGKYSETNRQGAMDKFDWKAETYPVYYDFKDNGEQAAPTITTRSEGSGLKDKDGKEVPMLSEDAYGRFKATASNVAALNLRLKKQYGDTLDLQSEQADKLRRIEAYKDVERQKPRVNTSRVEREAPQRSHSFYFGSGYGQTPQGQTQGNAFDDIPDGDYGTTVVKDGAIYDKEGNPKNGVVFIKGDRVPASVKAALKAGGINPDMLIGGVNAEVKDGKIVAMSNKNIGTVSRQSMEGVFQPKADTEPLKGQKLQFAEGSTPKGGSATYNIKGKKYSEQDLLDMGYTVDQIKKYKTK